MVTTQQHHHGMPVRTAAELETFGVPAPMNRDKVLTSLQEVHREWLAAASLIFVATASSDGRCDVSPKGDPPGFLMVLDDTTIAVPERAGNNRMDGFHNVLTNPHVGILSLIPGRADTLRVNGTAQVIRDAPFFQDMTAKAHQPRLALLVHVQEVFFHCPKAFRRARAWNPDSWQPDTVRSYAEIALELWRRGQPRDEVLAHYAQNVNDEDLYPSDRSAEPPAADHPTDQS